MSGSAVRPRPWMIVVVLAVTLGSGAFAGIARAANTIAVTPAEGAVDEGGSLALTATARDGQGNDITSATNISWSVVPAACGTLSNAYGATTTFTAARGRGGTACTVGAIADFDGVLTADTATITVRAPILGGFAPFLLIGLLAALIVGLLAWVQRRRKKKPGPTSASMRSLGSSATAPTVPAPTTPPTPPPSPR